MLLLFWMMLVVAGSCLLLLVPLFWASQVYAQFYGTRVVTCPETHQEVAITFHALRAAITGLDRRPVARIADCSRWSPLPVRCRQQCVPQALRAAPCGYGEVDPQRTKVIYHLPVLIAAFAAWCAGAIWHAQYLLRPRWIDALGLSGAELRQILWWRATHLATAAACLLFAYWVAWVLLAWRKREGAWQGVITATALWGALGAACLAVTGFAPAAAGLLASEAAYTLLASVLVGAIVGGLNGNLVLGKLDPVASGPGAGERPS